MQSRFLKRKNKILIGITGGIGSGKTFVCKMLISFGCEIIQADDIVKGLYENNELLIKALYKNFKYNIFENGKLSRVKFKNYLLKSKRNQMRVNKVVHPFAINEILKIAQDSRNKYVFIEAALIFESGFNKYLDLVILVSSKTKIRIERIRERDKISIRNIKSLIKLQLPEKTKRKKADIILENNNGTKELREKVKFLYSLLNCI